MGSIISGSPPCWLMLALPRGIKAISAVGSCVPRGSCRQGQARGKHGCWELNSGSLGKQGTLLTAELYPSPQIKLCLRYFLCILDVHRNPHNHSTNYVFLYIYFKLVELSKEGLGEATCLLSEVWTLFFAHQRRLAARTIAIKGLA